MCGNRIRELVFFGVYGSLPYTLFYFYRKEDSMLYFLIAIVASIAVWSFGLVFIDKNRKEEEERIRQEKRRAEEMAEKRKRDELIAKKSAVLQKLITEDEYYKFKCENLSAWDYFMTRYSAYELAEIVQNETANREIAKYYSAFEKALSARKFERCEYIVQSARHTFPREKYARIYHYFLERCMNDLYPFRELDDRMWYLLVEIADLDLENLPFLKKQCAEYSVIVTTQKKKAILLEKHGKIEEALATCNNAISCGLLDRSNPWEARKAKLEKKLYK